MRPTFDAQHAAKSIVRTLPLSKAAALLAALANEIEDELQNGWMTENGNLAEGSLESLACIDACEVLCEYIKTLRHSGDEMIIDAPLAFAHLGLV